MRDIDTRAWDIVRSLASARRPEDPFIQFCILQSNRLLEARREEERTNRSPVTRRDLFKRVWR